MKNIEITYFFIKIYEYEIFSLEKSLRGSRVFLDIIFSPSPYQNFIFLKMERFYFNVAY